MAIFTNLGSPQPAADKHGISVWVNWEKATHVIHSPSERLLVVHFVGDGRQELRGESYSRGLAAIAEMTDVQEPVA